VYVKAMAKRKNSAANELPFQKRGVLKKRDESRSYSSWLIKKRELKQSLN